MKATGAISPSPSKAQSTDLDDHFMRSSYPKCASGGKIRTLLSPHAAHLPSSPHSARAFNAWQVAM